MKLILTTSAATVLTCMLISGCSGNTDTARSKANRRPVDQTKKVDPPSKSIDGLKSDDGQSGINE